MIGLPPNTGIYIVTSDTRQLTRAEVDEINTLPHGIMLVKHKHRDSYKSVKVEISTGNDKVQAINYYNNTGIKINGLVKIDLSIRPDLSRKVSNKKTYPGDFDPDFYLALYPDLRKAGLTTPDQAYDHWLEHGKAEKRFCSRQTAWKDTDPKYKTPYYDSIKHKINNHINNTKFHETKELCITLITTNKEIASGKFQKFVEHFTRLIPSKNLCPDFYIFIDQKLTKNNKDVLNSCEDMLDRHFNYIKTVCLNIDTFNNIYTHIPPPDYIQRKYGRSSGPNIGFFRCMNFYTKYIPNTYKNVLLLEWDTRPMKRFWYDTLLRSIKSKKFLIYGSQYKGHGREQYMPWEGHINGVGIYNVSNPWLSFLLEEAEKCLLHEIRGNYSRPPAGPGMLNYDVAIWYYIKNHPEFIPLVVNSSEIVNISLDSDMYIKDQEIFSAHPECLIAHQKTL